MEWSTCKYFRVLTQFKRVNLEDSKPDVSVNIIHNDIKSSLFQLQKGEIPNKESTQEKERVHRWRGILNKFYCRTDGFFVSV